MRALRYDAFGPVAAAARLTEVAAPQPKAGEVLVRVRFASINPLDWKLVEGQFRLLAKSKPPCGIGTELSGTVEALGSGVKAPAIGTPVAGFVNPMARPPGALQEYVALAAGDLVPIEPADLEGACTLPVAGISALQMCRLAGVGRGDHVLVHGAAGGVGSFAVQIVHLLSAQAVATGSRHSQATLAALNPETAIDYTSVPVASWGGPFSVVLDCASTLGTGAVATLLAHGGRCIRTLPAFPSVVFDPLLNALRPIKRYTLRLNPNAADLRTLVNWLRSEQLKPLIAERFTLANAVSALERSQTGHARGKLVVRMD